MTSTSPPPILLQGGGKGRESISERSNPFAEARKRDWGGWLWSLHCNVAERSRGSDQGNITNNLHSVHNRRLKFTRSMRLRPSTISQEIEAQTMVNMETQRQRELIFGWSIWLGAVLQKYAQGFSMLGSLRAPVLV